MHTTLPDHAALYDALLARDSAYDGRVYVGVASTGVFCRLTCPARKPKAENCTFFDTVAACIEAGYRPCKRCHPLRSAAEADPTIAALLTALETEPDQRWSEGEIQRRGFDPASVRRSFTRHFDMTFLEMARQKRLREGFVTLANGGRTIDAQLEAGFDSPSAFRAAFAKMLGRAPGHFSSDAPYRADWITTPLGDMIAVCSETHLHILEFVERKILPAELARLERETGHQVGIGPTPISQQIRGELDHFFAGRSPRFETPIAYTSTAFSHSVWNALRTIPAGETRTYSELARHIGRPSATRAVARANGANPLAIIVPCHRVLGADGTLTGYGGGLWRKQKLLEIEQIYARGERDHDTG